MLSLRMNNAAGDVTLWRKSRDDMIAWSLRALAVTRGFGATECRR
jgi:hypothetical protein